MIEKRRVLIVEDDEFWVHHIRKKLVKLGYEVLGVFSSGEEAIPVACEVQPDVVLMDIVLGSDIDGITEARKIQDCLDVPVVYVTAYANVPVLSFEETVLPFGYLVKPFKDWELFNSIEIAVRRYERECQLRAREEDLRRRNRNLALLNQAGRAFSSTLELEDILSMVLESMRNLLDVLDGSIWLLDPETDTLVCRHFANPESQAIIGWRLPVGEGIVGWVAKNAETALVSDTRQDTRHFKGVDQTTGMEVRSVLAVPLWGRGVVIGVLEIVDTAPQRFEVSDLQVVESLAATASIAIQNARLYKQTQQDAQVKAALLEEVNHRVGNNLASILAIFALEEARVEQETVNFCAFLEEGDPQARLSISECQAIQRWHAIFRDIQSRIESMSAVHKLLSATQWSPLNLHYLISQVVHSVLSNSPTRGKIKITIDAPEEPLLIFPNQVMSLALVINELTTNSMKYAFAGLPSEGRECGELMIHIADLKRAEGQPVQITFADNGPGWPEDVLQGQRKGVGLRLVNLNVKRSMEGNVVLLNDDGAVARITFSLLPYH